MSGPAPRATIFALATPAGRGAVAVMRISGPRAARTLTALCGRAPPAPRRAVVRKLRDKGGVLIDEALVLWMPAPASFTGEDSVELHLHGGRAVVAAAYDFLVESGLRPAEAGEFTRRAFENDRLDLSQAEAIADLVEAESGAQRRQALAQLGGALSRRYDAWRESLLDALALLEAEIDFPDEELPDAVGQKARPLLAGAMAELQDEVSNLRGERVREGYRVAIVGAPNVGKSSVLNALSGRDAAIVTALAGTTRDIVEVPISLAGQTLVVADTAGLRSTEELVEAEGVRRAVAWSASADLRIGVVDRSRPETLQDVRAMMRDGDILVLNKSDLLGDSRPFDRPDVRTVCTIASTKDVAELSGAITSWLDERAGEREFPAVTRGRHRGLLQEALDHLERAMTDMSVGVELAAENVRLAVRALERVTGRSDPEAVLDRVFSSFCVGK